MNGNVTPLDVTPGSGKDRFWICDIKHSYEATPYEIRGRAGSGCPYCSNPPKLIWNTAKRRKEGLHIPAIDPEPNNDEEDPRDNHLKKFCLDNVEEYGHLPDEWYPEHPDWPENASKDMEEFFPKSNIKVWWLCSKGHCFDAYLPSRIDTVGRHGSGCRYCNPHHGTDDIWDTMGRRENGLHIPDIDPKPKTDRDDPRDNHLAYAYPEVAKLWVSPVKQEDAHLTPRLVTRQHHALVNWKCPGYLGNGCGTIFERKIYAMTRPGASWSCTDCSDLIRADTRAQFGVTEEHNFATSRPDLVRFWSKRNKSPPEKYTPTSNRKVWWDCPDCGEEGRQSPSACIQNKQGCPNCYLLNNNIETYCLDNVEEYGHLPDEWYPEHPDWPENASKDMKKILRGSPIEVYWICSIGREALKEIGLTQEDKDLIIKYHSFSASPVSRTNTNRFKRDKGCRTCNQRAFSRSDLEVYIHAEMEYIFGKADHIPPRAKEFGGISIDVIIREYDVAIECDGITHESRREPEKEKNKILESEYGISTFRVRDSRLKPLPPDVSYNQNEIQWPPTEEMGKLLQLLQRSGIKFSRSHNEAIEQYLRERKPQNVSRFQELRRIHYHKSSLKTWCENNGDRGKLLAREFIRGSKWQSISTIGYASADRALWRCEIHGEVPQIVHSRTLGRSNCLYCYEEFGRKEQFEKQTVAYKKDRKEDFARVEYLVNELGWTQGEAAADIDISPSVITRWKQEGWIDI
tara:strand:- start:2581 stop:4806 length:2226 start_codon:yes stop_codon:yes gene_type:complete